MENTIEKPTETNEETKNEETAAEKTYSEQAYNEIKKDMIKFKNERNESKRIIDDLMNKLNQGKPVEEQLLSVSEKNKQLEAELEKIKSYNEKLLEGMQSEFDAVFSKLPQDKKDILDELGDMDLSKKIKLAKTFSPTTAKSMPGSSSQPDGHTLKGEEYYIKAIKGAKDYTEKLELIREAEKNGISIDKNKLY